MGFTRARSLIREMAELSDASAFAMPRVLTRRAEGQASKATDDHADDAARDATCHGRTPGKQRKCRSSIAACFRRRGLMFAIEPPPARPSARHEQDDKAQAALGPRAERRAGARVDRRCRSAARAKLDASLALTTEAISARGMGSLYGNCRLPLGPAYLATRARRSGASTGGNRPRWFRKAPKYTTAPSWKRACMR